MCLSLIDGENKILRVKSISLEDTVVSVKKTSTSPGDDVEAWCTRCRMNLNHRVIAVVGKTVERVQCLTCGGDHKYYPPKGKPQKSEARAKAGRASVKTAKSMPEKVSPARAASEWATIMKDMPTDANPRPYKVTEAYRPSEFIEHAVFGVGRVLEIVAAERIHVIFKDGRKILICNKRLTTG
jgi:hypothetical protein